MALEEFSLMANYVKEVARLAGTVDLKPLQKEILPSVIKTDILVFFQLTTVNIIGMELQKT